MSAQVILGLILIILGYIAMYTPWFQLNREDGLSAKGLIEKHPEYNQIPTLFNILYFSWLVLLALAFYLLVKNSIINIFFLVGLTFGFIGLFIGVFVFLTGVSILPSRSPWTFFVPNEDAKLVGRFQVTWSVGVIILAIGLELFFRFF